MVQTLPMMPILIASLLHAPIIANTQPEPSIAQHSGTSAISHILDKYIQAATAENEDDLAAARRGLVEAFERQAPTADDRKLILTRAAELKPVEDWWSDPAVDLILLLDSSLAISDLPAVRETFANLNPNAKGAALRCLTSIDDRAAAQTFLDLARAASKADQLPMLMLGDYEDSDTALPVLVPGILDLTVRDDQPAYEVFHLFLGLLQQDRLSDETKAKTMATAQAAIERIVPRVLQYEKDTPLALRTPKQEDDHDDLCALAGLILDIVSHADAATIEHIARPALAVRDTNIRMWACLALLTGGKTVPPEVPLSIADDITQRERFMRILHNRGFGDAFPEKYRNNADAAAANMVQWLMHPNELGEAPAEFELAKRFEYTESGRAVEYFVYRFKEKTDPDEPAPNWLMGVCGPYTVGTFDREGGAHTFSRFKPWDPELLEEEVKEVRKLINSAWQEQLSTPSRRKPKW